MTIRRDKLERLAVLSPCPSPWGEMAGDEHRRHCLQCDKPVYDFAQLTPREIAGLIEASRGHLCARLTRDAGGRLLTHEPPAALPPLSPRRVSALVAATVAAVLGLTGAAWTEPGPAPSPGAQQGAGEQPGEDRPRRAGGAAGSLSGTLASDAGEPIPDAEVQIYNQLDGQQRAGRTNEEGRFSFASLPAGIYRLAATVRGQEAAQQGDLLLRAGEKRQVGLTVPAELWQRILSGAPEYAPLVGVIAAPEDPLRKLFAQAEVVVLGVAGESVVLRRQQYTQEVRTDLTISSVVKGETRERVISIFHEQYQGAPESLLQYGQKVLAFLEPREAADSRSSDGYVASDGVKGLQTMEAAELAAYGDRLEELARISRHGSPRPADVVDWLVGTAEDPVTREEALGELDEALRLLDYQAERHNAPVARYGQDLQNVYAEFEGSGGRLAGDVDPSILGAFLTGAHRERLVAALLRTTRVTAADLSLYELVRRWPDDRLLPWLIDRLPAADLSGGNGRRMMTLIAEALEDERLQELLAAGTGPIEDLEEQLRQTSFAGARRRLGGELAAAEEDLRQRFIAAMRGGRGRR